VKRNRGPVLAAALLLLALVTGIVGTTWGLVRTAQAKCDALAAWDEEARQRAAVEGQRNRAVTAGAEARTNEQKGREEKQKAEGAGDEAKRLAKEEKRARARAEEKERKAKFQALRAENGRHAIQRDQPCALGSGTT